MPEMALSEITGEERGPEQMAPPNPLELLSLIVLPTIVGEA